MQQYDTLYLVTAQVTAQVTSIKDLRQYLTMLLLRRPNYVEFDPFEFRSSPVLHKILSTT